jgi:hypothetical protein
MEKVGTIIKMNDTLLRVQKQDDGAVSVTDEYSDEMMEFKTAEELDAFYNITKALF